MHKLCFYVPESHLEVVKNAVLDAGAGQLGNYDRCCWQTLGQGQFRPLPGSDPAIGATGQVETLPEYKVEMVVRNEVVEAAVAALLAAHPFEEPAYDVWPLSR